MLVVDIVLCWVQILIHSQRVKIIPQGSFSLLKDRVHNGSHRKDVSPFLFGERVAPLPGAVVLGRRQQPRKHWGNFHLQITPSLHFSCATAWLVFALCVDHLLLPLLLMLVLNPHQGKGWAVWKTGFEAF